MMNTGEYVRHLVGSDVDTMRCVRCDRDTDHRRVSRSKSEPGETPSGIEYRWAGSVYECTVCQKG